MAFLIKGRFRPDADPHLPSLRLRLTNTSGRPPQGCGLRVPPCAAKELASWGGSKPTTSSGRRLSSHQPVYEAPVRSGGVVGVSHEVGVLAFGRMNLRVTGAGQVARLRLLARAWDAPHVEVEGRDPFRETSTGSRLLGI